MSDICVQIPCEFAGSLKIRTVIYFLRSPNTQFVAQRITSAYFSISFREGQNSLCSSFREKSLNF